MGWYGKVGSTLATRYMSETGSDFPAIGSSLPSTPALVGSSYSPGGNGFEDSTTFGITTDPDYSGLVCQIGTLAIPSFKISAFYIRY